MATVVTTPAATSQSDSTAGVGVILGIILAVVLGVLFFVYALPRLTTNTQPNTAGINIDANIPTPAPGGTDTSGGSGNPGTSGQ